MVIKNNLHILEFNITLILFRIRTCQTQVPTIILYKVQYNPITY